MEDIVGPLGFTDMDPEGMLTWGFDQLGTMPTIYNYPYYPEHIEALEGFEVDNKYVEFKLMVPDTIPEKYAKIAMMIEKRYNLHVRKLTKKDSFQGGYGTEDLRSHQRYIQGSLWIFRTLAEADRPAHQVVSQFSSTSTSSLHRGLDGGDHKIIGVGITMPSLAHALQKVPPWQIASFRLVSCAASHQVA